MTKNIGLRVFAACILVLAVFALGWFAYNAGLAQGVAAGAKVPLDEAGRALPYPYMMYGAHHFPGMGFFGLLVPLFLLCLFFWALRGLFGCHHRIHPDDHAMWAAHHMGIGENGYRDVPERFVEWHRRAHEKDSAADAEEKEA